MSGSSVNDSLKHLGPVFRDFREERGLTQLNLAKLLETRLENIQEIESGKTEPTPWQIFRASEVFKVQVSFLIECADDYDTDKA